MALFDDMDKVTRMRVPSREGRLTGKATHELQGDSGCQPGQPGKSKDQRKPSGSATTRILSLRLFNSRTTLPGQPGN